MNSRASRLGGLNEHHILRTPLDVLCTEKRVGEEQSINSALLAGITDVALAVSDAVGLYGHHLEKIAQNLDLGHGARVTHA